MFDTRRLIIFWRVLRDDGGGHQFYSDARRVRSFNSFPHRNRDFDKTGSIYKMQTTMKIKSMAYVDLCIQTNMILQNNNDIA